LQVAVFVFLLFSGCANLKLELYFSERTMMYQTYYPTGDLKDAIIPASEAVLYIYEHCELIMVKCTLQMFRIFKALQSD
jgi:hypothetical protein